MSERKKNVFELLIFAVILFAVIIYYGVNSSKHKSDNVNVNISAEQTALPETSGIVEVTPKATWIPEATNIPDREINSSDTVSAKSDEYHNETEEGVQ